jgi:predicted outer membrane repeat protein
MDYFRAHSLSSDDGVVAAWDSVASAPEIPSLRQLIAERGAELFPEFARRYAEVRSLPRSARRALQRQLAASHDLVMLPADWRRKLAYSMAGAALLLALSGAAQAGTINVNTGVFNPLDSLCSLREAIVSAETGSSYGGCSGATPSPNTINLPAGSKNSVTTAYSTAPYGNSGLPPIASNITIEGNSSTISRKSKSFFRLFTVLPTGNLTLRNATVSGGSETDGGGIFNAGYALLDGVTLTKNTATNRGGAISNDGTLTLRNNSIVTGNKAYNGGGLYIGGGEVEISDSLLSKNAAAGAGGGIVVYGGDLTIDPTIITGNKAYAGGGIAIYNGIVNIDDSTLSKNSAKSGGGGVFNFGGTLNVYNSSVITGNKGGMLGGGVFNCDEFNLTGSTITGNSAKLAGGGVANFNGTFSGYTCSYIFNNSGNVYVNKAKAFPDIFNYY